MAWVLTFRVKDGREEEWPLPPDLKQAAGEYLSLDFHRQRDLGCGDHNAPLFQPVTNCRTLVFGKTLSPRQVRRFQADNDLDQRIVVATKRLDPAVDFRTATASLHRLPYPKALALAARQGRILVSHDRRTLPGHFAQFVATETSPGLIIVSQKMAAELLHLMWAASEAQEYVNVIYDLP